MPNMIKKKIEKGFIIYTKELDEETKKLLETKKITYEKVTVNQNFKEYELVNQEETK